MVSNIAESEIYWQYRIRFFRYLIQCQPYNISRCYRYGRYFWYQHPILLILILKPINW